MKKTNIGEFQINAQYRIPNTDDELRKMKIDIWDETALIICEITVPLPIEKGRKLDILLTKKELRKLIKELV